VAVKNVNETTALAWDRFERMRKRASGVIKDVRVAARNRRIASFIVSYPKTGRTWLRVMLGKALIERYGLPQSRLLDTYKASKAAGIRPIMFSHGGPRYLFDFRPFDRLSFDADLYRHKRVIHLVRDVRDTLVSYYFQLAKREMLFAGDVSAFLRDPVFGAPKIITYYTLWFRNRNVPQAFLAVSYEQMRAQPVATLARMLEFVGISEAPAVAPAAVEFASFENMKKMETGGGFQRKMMQPGDAADKESYKVRKGKVGGFREYLSDDDLAYIDEQIAAIGDPACDWYCKATE
jgi:hypothetical protein